jgi:hypothetical protein
MNPDTKIKLIAFGFLASSVMMIVISSMSYINLKSSNVTVANIVEKTYKDAITTIYVGFGLGSLFTLLSVYLLAVSTCQA